MPSIEPGSTSTLTMEAFASTAPDADGLTPSMRALVHSPGPPVARTPRRYPLNEVLRRAGLADARDRAAIDRDARARESDQAAHVRDLEVGVVDADDEPDLRLLSPSALRAQVAALRVQAAAARSRVAEDRAQAAAARNRAADERAQAARDRAAAQADRNLLLRQLAARSDPVTSAAREFRHFGWPPHAIVPRRP